MAYEVLGNIVVELRKRVTFFVLGEEGMQLFLEVIWNEVEYTLKDLRKAAGQLE